MKYAEFFNLDGFDHRVVFDKSPDVWGTLGELRRYIQGIICPNIEPAGPKGSRISRTIVYHEGCEYEYDIEIHSIAPTKGDLRVLYNGVELPGASVVYEGAIIAGNNVQIGKGVVIESGAWIGDNVIIGDRTEVRQGAYVRGSVITGTGCVIGHATEVKNSIFLESAKAGHFAYVGDSILGRDVNLGAGTKLANLKIVRGNIQVNIDGNRVDTGMRKLGAILGDGTETGCNSVTSPGTLMGPGAMLYPNTTAASGFHPARTVISPAKDSVVTRCLKKR